MGLIGYGLRVHERWWPYFLGFERERQELNKRIVEICGGSEARDHKDLYKYFLETKALSIRDRIHYFSSFYYMLCELSLFSFGALAILVLSGLVHLARLNELKAQVFVAVFLVVLAAILQVVLLFDLVSIRNRRARRLSVLPSVFVLMAAGILAFSLAAADRAKALLLVFTDFRPWLLLFLSFIFERLGRRQWQSIVAEQVVLVSESSSELRNVYLQLNHAPPKKT